MPKTFQVVSVPETFQVASVPKSIDLAPGTGCGDVRDHPCFLTTNVSSSNIQSVFHSSNIQSQSLFLHFDVV